MQARRQRPAEAEVSAGKHMIEVRRPGYQPYTETMEFSGAEVIVADQPRGPAPVLVENLPPGDHVVEIRPKDPGYQPWRRNVRAALGQQAAACATFTANPPPPPAPLPPPGEPSLPVAFVPRSADTTYLLRCQAGNPAPRHEHCSYQLS